MNLIEQNRIVDINNCYFCAVDFSFPGCVNLSLYANDMQMCGSSLNPFLSYAAFPCQVRINVLICYINL